MLTLLPAPSLAHRLEHIAFKGNDLAAQCLFPALSAMSQLTAVDLIDCKNIHSLVLLIIGGQRIRRLLVQPHASQLAMLLEPMRIAMETRVSNPTNHTRLCMHINLPRRSSWPEPASTGSTELFAAYMSLPLFAGPVHSNLQCVVQIDAEPVAAGRKDRGCIVV